MYKINLELQKFAGNFAEFIVATIELFKDVTDLKKIGSGSLVIMKVAGKKANVVVGIFDSVKDDMVSIKLQKLDKDAVQFQIKDLENIKVIDEPKFATTYKGEHKKEFFLLVKNVLADVCKTERIGGLFLPEGIDKSSKEALLAVAEVKSLFEKEFGVELQARWSDTGGKVQKLEGGCFNLLIKNTITDQYNDLHREGAYHHSHRTLMVIAANKDGKISFTNKGDDELNQMITDYVALAGKFVAPIKEAKEEEKKEEPKAEEAKADEAKAEKAPKAKAAKEEASKEEASKEEEKKEEVKA